MFLSSLYTHVDRACSGKAVLLMVEYLAYSVIMKRPLLFQSNMPICFCVATLARHFGYMLFHFNLFTPKGTFLSVFLFQTAVWAVILFFFLFFLPPSRCSIFVLCFCVLLAHLSALRCLGAAFLPLVGGLNLSHSCNCPSPLWHSWIWESCFTVFFS